MSRKTLEHQRYLALVDEVPLRPLRNAGQHRRALAMYQKLVMQPEGKKLDAATRDYVNTLAEFIAEYQRASGIALDTSRLSAAEMVMHFLEDRGQSVHALAIQIGMTPSNLSEMLSGRRDWSKSAIAALIDAFPIDPRKFLARYFKAA